MFCKLSQSWSFLSLGVFSPRNHLLPLAVIDLKNHSECGNKILWRNIIFNINLRKLGIFDSFPCVQTYLLIQMKTKDFKRRSTTVTSLHVKNSTSFSRREDNKPALLQNMKNPLCWDIMETSVTCVQKYRLRVDRGLRIRLQWFC